MTSQGFYTLAELLRQQARPPHDMGYSRGWEVRLVMGPEEHISPEVELWPDRLIIRFATATLDATIRRNAKRLGVDLNNQQVILLRRSIFPRIVLVPVVTTGMTSYARIVTI